MQWCVLVLAGALACARAGVRYCGAKMCQHSNRHTFCQYPPGPSAQCRGYMEARLSAEEKVRLVARLNRRRSEAAAGRLSRLGTAGDMLKLRWVEELAREAQRWADQCRPPRAPDERDACRDLYSTTVGQCVASVVGEAPGLRVESMVDMWYMQSMLYKGNVSYYLVPMSNVSFYGDFAQMIWARSYMVGCGRSRFMSEWKGRLRSVERLVCNVAPRGPPALRPLWAAAAPAAVCPPRSVPDPDLAGLCNFQSNLDPSVDVDGAMTLEEHVLLSIVLDIEEQPKLDYPGSIDEFYMTKLAVVTMDNDITEVPQLKSAQKRDIIDTLGLDGNVVHIDNVLLKNNINQLINATRIIMKVENSTPDVQKVVTKKVKLIGRPKSYNIDDLNNVDGVNSLHQDNHLDDLPRRDTSKTDRDLYMEYSFLDDAEDSASSISESTSTSPATITENPIIDTSTMRSDFIETTPATESLPTKSPVKIEEFHQISSSDNVINVSAIFLNHIENTSNTANVTSKVPYKSEDDYFTDPETVRELQEALDRMEHMESLAQDPPAGKVRRELRNSQSVPPDVLREETVQSNDDSRYARENRNNIVEVKNKSDKNPMLNMVLKYMPYLKPYQNELLGTADSSASTVTLSCVLYSFCVALCVFSL